MARVEKPDVSECVGVANGRNWTVNYGPQLRPLKIDGQVLQVRAYPFKGVYCKAYDRPPDENYWLLPRENLFDTNHNPGLLGMYSTYYVLDGEGNVMGEGSKMTDGCMSIPNKNPMPKQKSDVPTCGL